MNSTVESCNGIRLSRYVKNVRTELWPNLSQTSKYTLVIRQCTRDLKRINYPFPTCKPSQMWLHSRVSFSMSIFTAWMSVIIRLIHVCVCLPGLRFSVLLLSVSNYLLKYLLIVSSYGHSTYVTVTWWSLFALLSCTASHYIALEPFHIHILAWVVFIGICLPDLCLGSMFPFCEDYVCDMCLICSGLVVLLFNTYFS